MKKMSIIIDDNIPNPFFPISFFQIYFPIKKKKNYVIILHFLLGEKIIILIL